VPPRQAQYINSTLSAYVQWVKSVQNGPLAAAHTEPKWNISTGKPYPGGWCRPQTDGPGLRARALMRFAQQLDPAAGWDLWELIRFDLDWIAKGFNTSSCDLWEAP
jgi:hypothetical protein